MTYVVHKYTIEYANTHTITLPIDAELLCAREQRGHLCVWYRCDPTVIAKSIFRLYVVGTGQGDCPSTREATYLDTALFSGGDLVLHVFYRKLD